MKNRKVMVVLSTVIIVLLIGIAIVLSPKNDNYSDNLLGINYDIKGNLSSLKYDSENPIVAMYIENYGSIVIELFPAVAPNTVNNFISLVEKGFYDNNSMHRLVPDFVLQGGDPTGTGSGGPGYTIKGEFTSNGYENSLSHEKWVVSMARSGDPDSAGSQFFICLGNDSFLDGNYAAFGRVIDGFDNINDIIDYEKIADEESGKLSRNLIIKKAIIDLKNKTYDDVEKK